MDYPLVSAIMVLSGQPLTNILAATACFRKQTYPYKELIIVNNAESQWEASSFNLRSERDQFIIDTPLKLSDGAARNHGILAANGQYLARFDVDCWHAPRRLEMQIESLLEVGLSVLGPVLKYSSFSGRVSYSASEPFLASMVCKRPAKIDYPDIDQGAEYQFVERMLESGSGLVMIDGRDLICDLALGGSVRPKNHGVSKQHFRMVGRFLSKSHQRSSIGEQCQPSASDLTGV